jgi:hypothetical protein
MFAKGSPAHYKLKASSPEQVTFGRVEGKGTATTDKSAIGEFDTGFPNCRFTTQVHALLLES